MALTNPLLAIRGYGERWDDTDAFDAIATLGYGEVVVDDAVPDTVLQNPLLATRGYCERWDDTDVFDPIGTLGYGELLFGPAVPVPPVRGTDDLFPLRPGRGNRPSGRNQN